MSDRLDPHTLWVVRDEMHRWREANAREGVWTAGQMLGHILVWLDAKRTEAAALLETGETTCAQCGGPDVSACGCYDHCNCGHDRRSHLASGVCTAEGCDCVRGLHGRARGETWLTTGQCATALGVSTDYVRGEIRDGRLIAEVIHRDPRPGRQRAYRAIRIYRPDWCTYLRAYWPKHPACSTFDVSRGA